MRNLIAIFFQAPGTRPWLVLLCLLIASALEGVGVASLLPLLSLLTGSTGDDASGLEKAVVEGLGSFGIEPAIGPLLAVITVTVILKALIQLFVMRYVGNAAAEMSAEYRRRLMRRILGARWSFLINQPMGQIANTISLDVHRTGECYVIVADLLTLVVQAIVLATVAVAVSWELALGAAMLGILMTVALNGLVRLSRRAGSMMVEQTSQLVTILTDALTNLKPIRAMGREPGFAALLDRRVHKLRRAMRKVVLTKEAMNLLQEIIVVMILAGGLYVGLAVWQIPLAEITVSGILLGRIISSIGKAQKGYQKAATLEAAYVSVNKLLRQTEGEAETASGGREVLLQRSIRLEGIDFAHEKLPVLHNVSLDVAVGELTVLLGPSGAGKTTIVDTILRLHEPAAGRVMIDDTPLNEVDISAWRNQIGYVPQELLLLHDSVKANLTLGDESVSDADIDYALRLAGADRFVSEMPEGLMTNVGEKGAKLSGGQRQRIALARALVKRPRLLILDEVTSALDPKTGAAIAAELARSAKDVAVLSITHRPEMLAVADRVFEVNAGRVREIEAESIAL